MLCMFGVAVHRFELVWSSKPEKEVSNLIVEQSFNIYRRIFIYALGLKVMCESRHRLVYWKETVMVTTLTS